MPAADKMFVYSDSSVYKVGRKVTLWYARHCELAEVYVTLIVKCDSGNTPSVSVVVTLLAMAIYGTLLVKTDTCNDLQT